MERVEARRRPSRQDLGAAVDIRIRDDHVGWIRRQERCGAEGIELPVADVIERVKRTVLDPAHDSDVQNQDVLLFVDGHNGQSGNFVININEVVLADEIGFCADGADNDSDLHADCEDLDCWTDADAMAEVRGAFGPNP